jgi:GNAT superfamily N-acetyltransferase
MNTAEMLALFDAQMRRDATPQGPGSRAELGGGVLRLVDGGADPWAGVVWSDLDERTADAAIAAQTEWADGPQGRGLEFEWKLYAHDRPADLGARLRAAGFVPEPPETLMVAEVAALPQEPQPPAGVRLETVTDAAGVGRAAAVHERAFGTSAERLRTRLLDQLERAPQTLNLIVAMAGDEPVSSARMEFHPGTDFASLWGGGTVEPWRGRGVYRALVAHRARTAAARGVRYLQVDASDDSRPILLRLGFAPLSVTTPYLREQPR